MDVFLVTAIVGLGDDFLLGQATVVGDVKEVAEIGPHTELPALFFDEFAQDDDPVAAPGPVGPMLELRGVFGDEALVEVAAVANNLSFDAGGAGSLVGEGIAGLSVKVLEVPRVHIIGALNEGRIGVVPEHEAHPSIVPAIEMSAHGEVGVAAQENIGKPGTSAELDRLIEHGWRPVVRRPIAAAIDDEERLAGIGERDDKRVISPAALVREVHAQLALARGTDQRTIGVDTRRFLS